MDARNSIDPSRRGEDEAAWLASLGLEPLSPGWAKGEILLGLASAVAGVVPLRSEGPIALLGGALVVLGLYLAMAGHRSHLYQAMNRQNARLARMIRDLRPPDRDLP